MTLHIEIDGVDYGPNGYNVVTRIATNKGSGSRRGDGSLMLVFPYSAAYDIRNFMEVQVYDLVGGTANGIFGGFVINVESDAFKGADYRIVSVKCVDYNFLWDAIVCRLANPIIVSPDTLPNQLTYITQQFQYGGNASVNKDIDSSTYVINLTGATVLPGFTVPGGSSFRDGMKMLMANVVTDTPALRPGYSITLESDGAGGVQAALLLVDRASTPTPIAAFAFAPTGGQRSIYEFKRTLDASQPMVNSRQSIWQTSFGEQFASFANSTSGAAYPNPYRNDNLTADMGYWWGKPFDDKDSQNGTDALNRLTRLVEAVDYPRETTTLTYDKLPTETLFIKLGDGVTVTWPPDQLFNEPYIVAGLAIAFPNMAQESYERVTLTLGLPMLELGEDGTEDVLTQPHEITQAPVGDFRNGSFELQNADGSPAFWNVTNTGAGANGYVDDTDAADGFKSFHFSCASPSDTVELASYKFAVHYANGGDLGAHYFLDLFMERGATNVNAIDIFVDWYDATDTLLQTLTLVSGLSLNTTWDPYHYSAGWPAVTPERTVAAVLRFVCNPASGAYDWLIDGLRFAQNVSPQRLLADVPGAPFMDQGNAVGADMIIGTTDANDLSLGAHNNLDQLNFTTGGGSEPVIYTINSMFEFDNNGRSFETATTQVPTNATKGFLNIPVMNGTPTGVPDFTGTAIPIVYDYTTNDLYAYNGYGGPNGWIVAGGGTGAALATNATTGFSYIPTCAGIPTGTPVGRTGTFPMVYDSTNNHLYIYYGGAWHILV